MLLTVQVLKRAHNHFSLPQSYRLLVSLRYTIDR